MTVGIAGTVAACVAILAGSITLAVVFSVLAVLILLAWD